MALKRCELLVLNNNNAGRIKEDVITLCKRLEKFIKLIKQKIQIILPISHILHTIIV